MNPKRSNDLIIISALLAGAFIVRLLYFWYAYHIEGDAVQFANIAQLIFAGKSSSIETSWYQLFCLWQIPFQYFIPNPLFAAALSSMIPGTLVILPVYAISQQLYSKKVAILASLITALHPNLVNYSSNGYMESFYLFWFAVSVWGLTALLQKPSWKIACGIGVASAFAFATRNEFIIFFLAAVCFIFTLALPIIRRNFQSPIFSLSASKILNLGLIALFCFSVTTSLYALQTKSLIGTYGLFEKKVILSDSSNVFIEPEAAALKIYGNKGRLFGSEDKEKLQTENLFSIFITRAKTNITESFPKALPRLFASPIYLFGLLLLALWLKRPTIGIKPIPLLMMALFTPLFYLFFFVEPRYLLPVLIPLNIYSSAGFFLFSDGLKKKTIPKAVLGSFILLLASLTIWKAGEERYQAEIHEQLAEWIKYHIPQNELIIGNGYGLISDTAFLSGNNGEPLVVSEDPNELKLFAKKQKANWLILYQSFIETYSPKMKDLFDNGIPGFVTEVEVTDSRGLRAKVYQLNREEDQKRGAFSSPF